MTMLSALVDSGHVVDLILIVMAVEAVWLMTRQSGRTRRALIDMALGFAPGVCLLLALRVALTSGDYRLLLLALAASFPFHILDILRRRSNPS